ncbi:Alpha/Beta hydrolase protein [Aspergillus karnatakaensis]|uniref:putative lipase/esterase n=1 Tax=Aspergillus karnatakaensis TaxID=1810916 RepID=UPI003CCCD149
MLLLQIINQTMMAAGLAEWTAYRGSIPKLNHDDEERNPDFLTSAAGSHLAGQVVTHTRTITARDGWKIPIRAYVRANQPPQAIVLFFHSGGFTSGSLETEDVSCRYIALGTPVVVVSVEYRLSPELQFPIPINDGLDVFHYVCNNVHEFIAATSPIDIVLSGTSSGGHLAAIISQHARSWLAAPENSKAAAHVTMAGILLRAPVTVNARDRAYIPPRWKEVHRSWDLMYKGAEHNRASMTYNHDSLGVPEDLITDPAAYPLWGDFAGLPRTYIQICGEDILRDDAVCYAEGLREAGVEVKETVYEDLPHIFWIHNHNLSVAKQAQQDCISGLRWLLGSVKE